MTQKRIPLFLISVIISFVIVGLASVNSFKYGEDDMKTDKNQQKGKIEVYDEGKENLVQVDRITKKEEDWRKQLTPLQYLVTRENGTENPFSSAYYHQKDEGYYRCTGCGISLFHSSKKYDSGSGWPSFWAPVSENNIQYQSDDSLWFEKRTELRCPRCDAHLGHVFNDGPQPTGKRFCVNGASLKFVAAGQDKPGNGAYRADQPIDKPLVETATFGAGCFWGVEATFRNVKGVLETSVGFMGGSQDNPTYKEVCTENTGHAEVVSVRYDSARLNYKKLLEVFWENHDPTTLNRQGPDVGDQYRSVVFFYTREQMEQAIAFKKELGDSGRFSQPIVTEILPAGKYYKAEEYHQRYLEKRGMATCHIK